MTRQTKPTQFLNACDNNNVDTVETVLVQRPDWLWVPLSDYNLLMNYNLDFRSKSVFFHAVNAAVAKRNHNLVKVLIKSAPTEQFDGFLNHYFDSLIYTLFDGRNKEPLSSIVEQNSAQLMPVTLVLLEDMSVERFEFFFKEAQWRRKIFIQGPAPL